MNSFQRHGLIAGILTLAIFSAHASISWGAPYAVQVQTNIVYGKGQVSNGQTPPTITTKNLLLDAYTPVGNTDPKKPAVVMVHGGGWSAGHFQYEPVISHARYLAERGYVTFSIMYRLSGENPTTPGSSSTRKGAYAGFRDTKAAVRWIRAHAADYGIDPTRIAGWGHSAGAYNVIAAAYSAEDEYLVDYAGDPTESFNTPGVSSRVNAVIDLWGGLVDSWGSPFGTALDKMTADSAPLMIVHGTSDGLVPFSNATSLNNKCLELGVPVAYFPLNGWGHEPWTAQLSGKSIDDATLDFLNQNMTGIVSSADSWIEWK